MRYANAAVLALLRSPAHRLLDRRICALRYAGRSARVYTLPVQYAPTDDGVVIAVGAAESKTWWRTMRTTTRIQIWLDGAWHDASARLVPQHDRPAALAAYRAVYPRTASELPLVGVRLVETADPPQPLRGSKLLIQWTSWVTAGEAVGFTVPAIVGAATVGASAWRSVPAFLAAGAVEGALLGMAQAHVLRRAVPELATQRWVVRTSLAAVLAYALGLLPSTMASRWPTAGVIALGTAAGVALLLSIGVAQWTVLRHHVARAGRWIAVTAGAWLAGLAIFMAVASPLWQPGQPGWLIAAIGAGAGLLMAATVAAVTGAGLVHLLRANDQS